MTVTGAVNAEVREDGTAAVFFGEPGRITDGPGAAMASVSASELLDLYADAGTGCLQRLRGSWAAVIVDPGHDRVLLASDRMGRQPLYCQVQDDCVLVGSSLGALRELAAPDALDCQALYHYLYFHMVPAPDTVAPAIQKLGPAEVLELTASGRQLRRYWTPAFREAAVGSPLAAQAELKSQLRIAVARCAAGARPEDDSVDQKVGAFLSGGLDSSTVAGMLSEIRGGNCDAYAIGFDADGYDEMPYARLAARHFGIRLHEYYVTPAEVVQALPKVAAAFDEPFGNSSALPAYFCARMAESDGVDTLLAGDGGDELFAGNTRYLGQRIFEDYRRLPEWLRSRFVEPIVQALPEVLPLVSKGRSFIRQAAMPLPKRLQYYSFLEQNSPHDVFMPGFLDQVNTGQPLTLLERVYQRPQQASQLNRMLFLDWQITLADNDLRKVTQACELAGVKVRYPMLDDDLVAFSTRIPSDWKLPAARFRRRKLRHFYKQTLGGWLPDATIAKSKHGFGLPFGVWMKNHKPLQELAFDNIVALKRRGIFLPGFLDQAIANHRDGHAAYFGELIWVLTCLELWLSANAPGYHFEQH